MKLINKFKINTSDMSAVRNRRKLTIFGDPGAVFTLMIKNGSGEWYDFITSTFSAGEKKLSNIELNGSYTIDIFFPAISGSDDQYDFYLLALSHFETEISFSLSNNKVLYQTSISQKLDTTITYSPITTTTGDFAAMPSNVTLVNPPGKISRIGVSLDWTIAALNNSSGGALIINRQPISTDFYIEDSFVANGSGSGSATALILTDITDLVVGATLSMINGVTKLGVGTGGIDITITAIDESTKTITLSEGTTSGWSNTHVIKFRAYGTQLIKQSKKINLDFEDLSVALVELTKTTDNPEGNDDGTTTITLDNCYGIRAGSSNTTVSGIGFDNDTIQYVTGNTYGGPTITVTSAQTLEDNTILTFSGSGEEAIVKAAVFTSQIPNDDLIISLNIDNILTSSITP